MTPFNKKTTGVVVEAYHHDKTHLIVVIRDCKDKHYYFFYVNTTPKVELGDIAQMDFPKDKIFILRRIATRPFMKFQLKPLIWPGTLLAETMADRIN